MFSVEAVALIIMCVSIPISDDCSRDSVLLSGFSRATHLKLISKIGKVCHTSLTHLCCPFFVLHTIYIVAGGNKQIMYASPPIVGS